MRHSARTVAIGSIPAARRAGSHAATPALARSRTSDAAMMSGSPGATPYSQDPTAREQTHAGSRPIESPRATFPRHHAVELSSIGNAQWVLSISQPPHRI
jgi:hypothetical protein